VAVPQVLEMTQALFLLLGRADWAVEETLLAELVQHTDLLVWVSQELMGLVVEQVEMLRLEEPHFNLEVQAL